MQFRHLPQVVFLTEVGALSGPKYFWDNCWPAILWGQEQQSQCASFVVSSNQYMHFQENMQCTQISGSFGPAANSVYDKLRAETRVLIKFAYTSSAAASSKVMAIARLQLFKLNTKALPFGRLNRPGAAGENDGRKDEVTHMSVIKGKKLIV